MNKNDIAEKISKEFNISLNKATQIVNYVFNTIGDTLENGESVSVFGFGIFKPQVRKARKARNPRTNEVVNVPEKTVPVFTPSRALKARFEK